MDFQNGEVQGNGHECLFAAGQQRDGFEGLPGRLGLDLDAAAQDVVLVLQLQAGGAAAEEVGKGGLEALVDEFELLRENHCHLAGDLLDNARQLLLGLFHVVALVGQVGVAAVDTVELLNGADIDSTQRIDLPLQLADAAAGLGDALQFNALGLRVGVAELVVLPQAVQNLLFLHGRGGHFLFQLGCGPLQVQQVLVHLLALLVPGGALGLQGDLFVVQGLQAVPEGLTTAGKTLHCLPAPCDLALGAVDVLPVGADGFLLLAPVSRQLPRQLAQVGGTVNSGLPLGGQSRQIGFLSGDFFRQGAGPGQQLRLAGEGLLRLGPQSLRQGFLLRHGFFSGGGTLDIVSQAAIQALQLAVQVFKALLQGAQQNIKVVFGALQPQDLVLSLAALALRGLQLVLGGVQFPVCRLLVLLCGCQLFMHGGGAAVQFLQLGGTAQHTGAAAGGTAGHGAAPVDDLTVQRHDAEGVLVLPGHGDAAVHVLHDDRAAQEVLENICISCVKGHQPGGDAYESKFILNPALAQLVAPDGSQRQEGSATAVPLLQKVDSGLGVFLPIHHDILQAAAQSDLDSQGIAAVRLHQIRHGAVDAPQAVLGLAHQLDGLGEALVLLLHLRQQPDAVIQRAYVHGQPDPLFTGGGSFLLPLLHPQAVARDDVGNGGGFVLRVLQGTAVGFRLPAGFLQPCLGVRLVPLHGFFPLPDLAVLRRDGGSFGPCISGGGHSHGLPAPEGLRLRLGAARLFGSGSGPLQQSVQSGVQLFNLLFDFSDTGLLLRRLLFQAAGTAVRLLQFGFRPADILLIVGNGALQHGDSRFLLLHLAVQFCGLGTDALGLHVLLPHLLAELLALGVEGVQGGAGLVPGGFRGMEIRFQLPGAGLQLVQIGQPHGDLQKAQLVPEDQVLLRLFRLILQGTDLQFQLGNFVVDADQVLLRPLQLPLGLFLPMAELGNAGGFLEDLPALAALGGQNLVDLALADDGVALSAHAGIHEQLGHILEADGLAVDIVFALAAAVVPAGNSNLALLHGGENMLRVVDHQRHLGKAHLGPLRRTAENNILHLGAAKALGALLAHDPADGVRNVGLTGAVGSHDGGDILTEIQNGLIREGFEALDLQCL